MGHKRFLFVINRRSISMPIPGPQELIIILVIVIILFGVGRISKIAGELGGGLRAFKEGLQGDEKETPKEKEKEEKAEA
jgi:sec-independent protein translocase protein TatA